MSLFNRKPKRKPPVKTHLKKEEFGRLMEVLLESLLAVQRDTGRKAPKEVFSGIIWQISRPETYCMTYDITDEALNEEWTKRGMRKLLDTVEYRVYWVPLDALDDDELEALNRETSKAGISEDGKFFRMAALVDLARQKELLSAESVLDNPEHAEFHAHTTAIVNDIDGFEEDGAVHVSKVGGNARVVNLDQVMNQMAENDIEADVKKLNADIDRIFGTTKEGGP